MAKQLAGIPDVVPENIADRPESNKRIGVKQCHINPETGVFLPEQLPALYPVFFTGNTFPEKEIYRTDCPGKQKRQQ